MQRMLNKILASIPPVRAWRRRRELNKLIANYDSLYGDVMR